MVDRAAPYLTKSKYVAGLQCKLRLWKQVHAPPPYQEPEPGARQYEGARIGELARQRFPGGVLVDNEAYDHHGALQRTRSLLADRCPAIFEGAFESGNRRVRVDILKHLGEGKWALYEVKSATKVKPGEHYEDAAFQADVLRRSGVEVASVFIIHVNNKYRLGADGIDVTKFFCVAEVGDQLSDRYDSVGANVLNMSSILAAAEPPNVSPGVHCWQPRGCEFREQCTAGLTKDWVGNLPRITQAQIDEFAAAGVERIAEIQNDATLRGLQKRIRSVHHTGKPFVSSDIQDLLLPLAPPAFYLDFESLTPGIPLYPGTGPYQHIPFLFSLHRSEGGALSHSDYIAPPSGDPRRAIAEELIRQTSLAGPIIVYGSYESTIIGQLARDLPDLAPALKTIMGRLRNLLSVVRKTVYLSAFEGSYSIKAVGPALSNLTYADLNIGDGAQAAAVYQALVERQNASPDEIAETLCDLREYCERDTRAMVDVHLALVQLANTPRSA